MTKEQVKEFLDAAHKEYIKVYEERFQKVARKAFLDGCMAMATFTDADGDYKFEWEEDTFKVIKLANDIDNETGFPLTLNEYQDKAMSTCMSSCDNFSYMMLNLVGEVGEFASKVAKDIRKREVFIGDIDNELNPRMPFDAWEVRNSEYMHDAGDILWQLAGLCNVMEWRLEDVAKANLAKLASRKQRGKIDGDELIVPTKQCSVCGEIKPINEFARRKSTYKSICKECNNERLKIQYKKRLEKMK